MTDSAGCSSVVVTFVGVAPATLDAASPAAGAGLSVSPLVSGEVSVSAVITDHATSAKKLLVGTGDASFDSACAAALGAALVVVSAGDSVAETLTVKAAEAVGGEVAATVAADGLTAEVLTAAAAKAEATAAVINQDVFEHWLIGKARADKRHIVLPEGDDDRILYAADQLLAQQVCDLTILGDPAAMTARAKELGLDISGAKLDNPDGSPLAEEFARDFYELRKAKGVTEEQAAETMKDISYFATMMIHKGLADGMVSGAAHTTAHTIKPSFQIIKTKPGVNVVSSLFLMVLPGKVWGFGDCAVNPNPTAEQLAEIAIVSAETAAQFGIDPKVAMLSYSTGSSGHGPDVDRCVAAVAKAKELAPSLDVDGPLQFDAAVDPGVAAKKAPNSAVAGNATVMIFPDLECGNICYKAVQRTSGALAVGPILQGLKKPVNDLSRGATVADIVNTVAITAIQAQG